MDRCKYRIEFVKIELEYLSLRVSILLKTVDVFAI